MQEFFRLSVALPVNEREGVVLDRKSVFFQINGRISDKQKWTMARSMLSNQIIIDFSNVVSQLKGLSSKILRLLSSPIYISGIVFIKVKYRQFQQLHWRFTPTGGRLTSMYHNYYCLAFKMVFN